MLSRTEWISSRFHGLNCHLLRAGSARHLCRLAAPRPAGWSPGRFVLPGLVVILALSGVYAAFHETVWLDILFYGLKAAVLAIVVEAVIRIGRRALKTRLAVAIAAVAFVLIFVLGVPFPLIVLGRALRLPRVAIGPMAARARLRGPGRRSDRRRAQPGRADAPPGAQGPRRRAPHGRRLSSPGALGFDTVFTEIGTFFVARGGLGSAYAVLAYVADAAVLARLAAPGEMLDGLAMAETTPGPLILVLSFVGFLAAFRDSGGLDPMLAGLLGGLLAAWVTFVPSFLWIFLGAPYMERLRGNRELSGALAAITTAVVASSSASRSGSASHVLFGPSRLDLSPLAMPWPVWARSTRGRSA
jgi:chromate transporter